METVDVSRTRADPPIVSLGPQFDSQSRNPTVSPGRVTIPLDRAKFPFSFNKSRSQKRNPPLGTIFFLDYLPVAALNASCAAFSKPFRITYPLIMLEVIRAAMPFPAMATGRLKYTANTASITRPAAKFR